MGQQLCQRLHDLNDNRFRQGDGAEAHDCSNGHYRWQHDAHGFGFLGWLAHAFLTAAGVDGRAHENRAGQKGTICRMGTQIENEL